MILAFSWRTWLFALVMVGFGWYVRGEQPTFTIARGPVTATETERTECYYQVGRDALLVFRPESTPCQVVAQELLGRTIILQAVIEAP